MTRKQKKTKVVKTLGVLAVGGMFALAPIASAQTTNGLPVRPTVVAKSQLATSGPMQMMKRALNLTDEQVRKLEPVMKEQQAKFAAVRQDSTLSHQDRLAKFKEIRAAADAKIKPILTPEQAGKWQKMRPSQQNHVGQQARPSQQGGIQQPQQPLPQPQPAQPGTLK